MDDLKNSRGIQSVDYTAEILELFCQSCTTLSLKDISTKMNASSAKLYPYLVSLVRSGLLKKCDHNSYEIGQLTLDLAFKALNYLDPLEETSKIAKEVCHMTSYQTVLSTWGSFGPTVIRTFEVNSNLYSKIRVGSVMSIVNSTIGNTFSRFLPISILKESLQFEEFRYAGIKLTATEKKEFLKDIKSKEFIDNFTIVENRPVQGLTSMSVPIFSLSGEIQFVITIFNSTDLIMQDTEHLKNILNEKLFQLSRTLGTT